MYFFVLDASSCGPNFKETERTAVVTAFKTELQPFLDATQKIEVCTESGITYHLLSHNGTEFVAFQTGVGPENANSSTQKAFEVLAAKDLLFSGIAGSVHADYAIGHTLVAREWINLATEEVVAVDDTFLSIVQEMEGVEIVALGATSPTFVEDIAGIPQGVSLVDMETYEVARIAKEKGIPFIAFRSISDYADGEEKGVDFVQASLRSSERVLEFLEMIK